MTISLLETAPRQSGRLQLEDEEAKISKNVLKIIDVKLYNLTDFETKQREFKETCLAIHSIIVHKLYRNVSNSLESYFKKRWCVSRAQTYRLFECAAVLQLLGDAEILPHKERICRQLRLSTGLVKSDICKLWADICESTGGSEILINAFNIEMYWQQQYGNHEPKRAPKKLEKKRKYSKSSEADIESMESDLLRSRTCTFGDDYDSDGVLHPVELKNSNEYQLPDWIQLQSSISRLNEGGYRIESLVNGQWKQPLNWKLVKVEDISCKPSMLHLLMAAEWAYADV